MYSFLFFSWIPVKPECVHQEPVTLGVVPKRDAEVRVKLILYISFEENLESLHTKLAKRNFPFTSIYQA